MSLLFLKQEATKIALYLEPSDMHQILSPLPQVQTLHCSCRSGVLFPQHGLLYSTQRAPEQNLLCLDCRAPLGSTTMRQQRTANTTSLNRARGTKSTNNPMIGRRGELFQLFQVTLVAGVYGAAGGRGTLAAGCSVEHGRGRRGEVQEGGALQSDGEQRSVEGGNKGCGAAEALEL